MNDAVISPCGTFRLLLSRDVPSEDLLSPPGELTFGFFGVNPSTAGPIINDTSVIKLIEFTRRNGGRRFFLGNPHPQRTKSVKELVAIPQSVHDDNWRHIELICREADVLIPCWGRRSKVPKQFRSMFDPLADALFATGKPVRVFGLTDGGDPLHPLMLPYSTPLVPWERA